MQIFYWAITHLHHVEIKAVRRIVSHESGLHVVHVDEDVRLKRVMRVWKGRKVNWQRRGTSLGKSSTNGDNKPQRANKKKRVNVREGTKTQIMMGGRERVGVYVSHWGLDGGCNV